MALIQSDIVGPLAGAVGLGFRAGLAEALLAAETTAASFVEVAPENHLRVGGARGRRLAAATERWPVVSHGLCGDLAGAAPVDEDLIDALGAFLRRHGARWYSDHLCFTHVASAEVHDLLPLPHTEEAVARVAARVRLLRERLGLPVAVENISAYLRAPTPAGVAALDEPGFVRRVVEAADCLLLLDVNNVYVNAVNFGFDSDDYVARLPLERIVQIHVAGHLVQQRADDGSPTLLLDTHGEAVAGPVYDLLARTLARIRNAGLALPPILLERDHQIPPLPVLEAELRRLQRIVAQSRGPTPGAVEPLGAEAVGARDAGGT